jgi:hypothetical protein
MAQRIADDPAAPIRDRQYALDVLHRLTLGRPVTASDEWRLRVAHGRRRGEVAALALARLYGLTP